MFRTFSGSWRFEEKDGGCEVHFRYNFTCRPKLLARPTACGPRTPRLLRWTPAEWHAPLPQHWFRGEGSNPYMQDQNLPSYH